MFSYNSGKVKLTISRDSFLTTTNHVNNKHNFDAHKPGIKVL